MSIATRASSLDQQKPQKNKKLTHYKIFPIQTSEKTAYSKPQTTNIYQEQRKLVPNLPRVARI